MTLADYPIYLSTIAEATTLRNFASMLHAKALAIKVFPVPGGPYMRQPEINAFSTFWRFDTNSFEKLRICEW